jgi:hypothetical protein
MKANEGKKTFSSNLPENLSRKNAIEQEATEPAEMENLEFGRARTEHHALDHPSREASYPKLLKAITLFPLLSPVQRHRACWGGTSEFRCARRKSSSIIPFASTAVAV